MELSATAQWGDSGEEVPMLGTRIGVRSCGLLVGPAPLERGAGT
jgi:hypothetical protein